MTRFDHQPNDHDHQACIDQAMTRAATLCQKRGARLTRLRKQVLELIWQNHMPLGAYQLMAQLQAASERTRVAPPTVYRALDFLLDQGLIHKVHSLNAFIGCANPRSDHHNALFICNQCGLTEEVASPSIQQAINLSASQHKFSISDQVLEIVGRCERCRDSLRSHSNKRTPAT